MKKFLIPLACLFVLAGTGLWILVRRNPMGVPQTTASAAFKIEPHGPGLLIHYTEGQTPLRALRWLPPTQEGLLPVQVLSQNDRQRILLFRRENLIADLLVPRPAGVREGFFNFAELRDAIVVPGDVAVLLYRSADVTTGELPLIIAVDLSTQTIRWVHRASGERLALGGDTQEAAAFLFGPGSPVLRLPLALRKGEQAGASPFRAGLTPIEMPAEIKELCDLLPTGPWSFLAAHPGGLSSYSGVSGWKHWQPQVAPSLPFSDFKPSVVGSRRAYWWQPFPGVVTQVKADGTPLATHDSGALAPPEPWNKDGMLLSLRGSDPAGNLWFTLAMPSMPSPVATPGEPPSQPQEDPGSTNEPGSATKPETSPTQIPSENWTSYAAESRERLYRWSPERGAPIGITLTNIWATLPLPQAVNRPASFPVFHPESGHLLVESGLSAWLVPLEALPMNPDRQAGGKSQAR